MCISASFYAIFVLVRNQSANEGNENEAIGIAFCETLFGGGTWLQTSYNRQLRKHFAGKGFSYDPDLDIFVPPAPFPSWTRINNENDDWAPPVAWPDDGNFYRWNEDDQQWVLADKAASALQTRGTVDL